MPVGDGIDVVGHDVGMGVAAPPGRHARDQRAHALVDRPGDLAIHQRQVDILPLTGLRAVVQGGKDTDRGIHSAHHVGDPHADLHRRTVGRSGQAHDPAVALRHEVIARLRRIRSGLPEPRDRAEDQVRKLRPEGLMIQPVAFQPARLEILHDHVCPGGQSPHRALAFGRGNIQRDGELVAVGADEIGRKVRVRPIRVGDEGRAPLAGIVAAGGGVLDLEHPRAEVAQHLRRGRPGENPAQVEHRQPGERSGCRCVRGVRHKRSRLSRRRSG